MEQKLSVQLAFEGINKEWKKLLVSLNFFFSRTEYVCEKKKALNKQAEYHNIWKDIWEIGMRDKTNIQHVFGNCNLKNKDK